MKKRNFYILWLRDSLLAAAASLTSTSVLSAHLLHTGMAEDRISFYLAFLPVVNLAVSLLFSGITSKTEKTVSTYTFLCLVSGVLTALYALLFKTTPTQSVLFPVLMVLGCLLTAVTAVRTIFDYKLPCEVMELEQYSLYVSVSGIISSVFAIAAGVLLTFAYKKLPFVTGTCLAYFTAGVSLCIASVINRFLKKKAPVSENKGGEKSRAGIRELLKDKSFKALIVPNFVRGIGMAVVPMMTILAVNENILTEADGAAVTVCTYAGTLISCVLYAYLAPKIKVRKLCAGGAAVFCALAVSLSGGKALFYVCYTLAYIGYYAISCAVPDLVYKNADTRLMSVFHTWRLALSTVGTAAATAVIGKLIGKVPPVWILLAGVASHIICAAAYCIVFKNRKTENIVREA